MDRIPQNIMLKSVYNLYQFTQANYLTESINDICSYISIYESELENIEIEAKLGHFDFRGSNILGFRDITDTFKIPYYDKIHKDYHKYQYMFNSGLNENQFFMLWYFIGKESEKNSSEINILTPVNYKETIHKSGSRRSIAFEKGIMKSDVIINKKDKQHVNVRNKGNDFRITCAKEEKQSKIENDDAILNYREKFRSSYKFRFFRLDFTIVSNFKDLDPNSPKTISYEVEFEIDELNKCGTGEELRMILNRFIQNVFCFYHVMSPDFYNLKLIRPRFPGDSIYGDYMEKHVPYEKLVQYKENNDKKVLKLKN